MVRIVAGTADSDIAPQLRRPRHRLPVGHRGQRGHHLRIDNTPGLGTASGTEQGTVWQLEPAGLPSRVVVRGRHRHRWWRRRSPVPAGAGPPAADRRGRRSALAGQPRRRGPLTPVDGGWQQAFALPAERRHCDLGHPRHVQLAADRPGSGAAGRGRAGRARRPSPGGPRSHQVGPTRRHPLGAGVMSRRVVTVAAVLVGLLMVGIGGTLVDAADANLPAVPDPPGRSDHHRLQRHGSRPATQRRHALRLSATRQAPGRDGRLTGDHPRRARRRSLTITDQGKAEADPAVEAPVVMAGEGVMATAGSAATLSTRTEGVDAGLMAAPCLAPGTSHWFSGARRHRCGPDRADLDQRRRRAGPGRSAVLRTRTAGWWSRAAPAW